MARRDKKQRERDRKQRRAERRVAGGSRPLHVASERPRSGADPIRGIVADLIDPDLCWHIARTLPRMGGRALAALKEIQVATYLPRASEVVVRRGRRVVRRTPLVMRTVFIGVRDATHLRQVYDRPGIAEVVSHPELEASAEGNVSGFVRRPARLDPATLQRFVNALADGEIVQPVGVKVGQNVVVMAGPFASFPAVVEAILPNDRIKVGISIFGRPSPVELEIAEVQRV